MGNSTKVLVTGASGFLGHWMTRYLLDQGLEVRVLCRHSSDLSELEGLKYEKAHGDVTAPSSLLTAMDGVDSVFHLAGVIAYSRQQRFAMERVNVLGTSYVVEACLQKRIRRLVHLSSVTAIGASFDGREPLNEESSYNLTHLNLGYFETKREAEELVRRAVNSRGLNAVILNPATIYGAGDAKKGSRSVQLKVARGKFPFYTSGGVNVIAVEDVVAAIFTAWKSAPSGERYILGGENLTIKELFTMIAEEAQVNPPRIYLPNGVVHSLGVFGDFMERFGRKAPVNGESAWTSILFHWFDNSKAKRELGLNPKPARDAIRASLAWSKKKGLI